MVRQLPPRQAQTRIVNWRSHHRVQRPDSMSDRRRLPSSAAVQVCCALTAAVILASCSSEPPGPQRTDPAVANPPSVGFVDTPAAGTVVGPILHVAGWVADESGVAWVRLYADDQIIEHIPMSVPRPDVEKEFPQFSKPGALHGWHATIDFGDHVGYTHISAEALDGRGALTRFAQLSLKIRP